MRMISLLKVTDVVIGSCELAGKIKNRQSSKEVKATDSTLCLFTRILIPRYFADATDFAGVGLS